MVRQWVAKNLLRRGFGFGAARCDAASQALKGSALTGTLLPTELAQLTAVIEL